MLYIVKTINGQKTKVPLTGAVVTGNPVGSLLHTYKKIQPKNYLYCDGSTFDENQYPDLYLYLGTNVLPDYRECVEVGAEKNTTDIFDSTETDPSTGLPGTQSHDVFGQGEFKDDQLQNITGSIQLSATPQAITGAFGATQYAWAAPNASGYSSTITFDASKVARTGTTTRTKEKAVYVYIKAVDGVDISDEDYFLNTVKNFVQEKNSYSTDEMLTGGTWIDGKPIYRKVLDIGAISANATKLVPHNVTGLDKYVSVSGVITATNGNKIPLPFTTVDNAYTVQLQMTDTALDIFCSRSIAAASGYAIIEYTKTTD